MDLYRNKYRSQSARRKDWDYGAPGYYYVTICAKDRENYFGEVVMCDCPGEHHTYATRAAPWAGICAGNAGTHNHASLQPTAPPAQASAVQAEDSGHAVIRLTAIGEIARQNWIDIPTHFPFVAVDEFIVMPNHLHGILYFRKPGYRRHVPNSFGPQSANRGSVIRNFKGATKSCATANKIEFAWQSRFHDEVVTSGKGLDRIRAYIPNNPARWIQHEKIEKIKYHES